MNLPTWRSGVATIPWHHVGGDTQKQTARLSGSSGARIPKAKITK